MAVDAMIPIGRVNVSSSSIPQSPIGIDTIIAQARQNKGKPGDKDYRPLYCIYVAVGRAINVAQVINTLEREGASPTPLSSALVLPTRRQPVFGIFAGCAMGEWFMDNGMDALIIYDDLKRSGLPTGLWCSTPFRSRAIPVMFSICTAVCWNDQLASTKTTAGSLTALPH